MSAVLIMTPAIIAGWPAISAAVVGAMGAMGYAAVKNAAAELETNASVSTERQIELEIEKSDVLIENVAREESLEFIKDDVKVSISRDIRGKLKICVSGENLGDAELRAVGTEISQKVTQQYIYDKVVSELQSTHFNIVDQEVTEDDAIRIHIRNWQ